MSAAVRLCIACLPPPLIREGRGGFSQSQSENPPQSPFSKGGGQSPTRSRRSLVVRSALRASPPFSKGGVHRAVVSFADVQHCSFPSFGKGGRGRIFKISLFRTSLSCFVRKSRPAVNGCPLGASRLAPIFSKGENGDVVIGSLLCKGGRGWISICV